MPSRKRENGPEMRAFRVFDIVYRLPNRQSQGANRRKSPATPANIPVLQRLSVETEFDHDRRQTLALRLCCSPAPTEGKFFDLSLQGLKSGNFEENFRKVSGQCRRYSRFPETLSGDEFDFHWVVGSAVRFGLQELTFGATALRFAIRLAWASGRACGRHGCVAGAALLGVEG
jgi:hypothetical protein